MDPSLKYIPQFMYLHMFNEDSKSDAYFTLNIGNGEMSQLLNSDSKLSRKIMKAEKDASLLYTEASFTKFPDLILTDTSFTDRQVISDANPQEKGFGWGSIEPVRWTTDQGRELKGLLVKPYDFDLRKNIR